MKKTHKYLFLLLALAGCMTLSSCSDEPEMEVVEDEEEEATTEPDFSIIDMESDFNVWFSMPQEERKQNELINYFSVNLLQAINKSTPVDGPTAGNLVFSPASLALATIMLANAGDDDFKEKAAKVFNTDDFETLTTVAAKVSKTLPSSKNGAYLSLANSVWVDKDYSPKPYYVSLLDSLFGAPVNTTDLHSASTLETINSWANRYTNGLIPQILSSPINEAVKALWLNAITLQGSWQFPFDPEQTTTETFFGTRGEVDVQMMHNRITEQCWCFELNGFTCAELFFGLENYVMFIQPPQDMAIDEATHEMDTDFWKEIFEYYTASGNRSILTLHLPKFNLESDIDMTDAMADLGLPMEAVLPGVGIDTKQWLGLTQKSKINIDEKGASVSAVSYGKLYYSNGKPTYIAECEMQLDKPFFVVFYSATLKTVLFIARVANP